MDDANDGPRRHRLALEERDEVGVMLAAREVERAEALLIAPGGVGVVREEWCVACGFGV